MNKQTITIGTFSYEVDVRPERPRKEQEKLAKKWAKRHGYEGREGGWIHRVGSDHAIVQGYHKFYLRNWQAIESELGSKA